MRLLKKKTGVGVGKGITRVFSWVTTVCSFFVLLFACLFVLRLHLFHPYLGNKILFLVFSLIIGIVYLLYHVQLLPMMVHTHQSWESQLICIFDVYTHMLGSSLHCVWSIEYRCVVCSFLPSLGLRPNPEMVAKSQLCYSSTPPQMPQPGCKHALRAHKGTARPDEALILSVGLGRELIW